MTPEERFLAHLGLIDRIVVYVCRRNYWDGDDAQEFGGYVRLKLIENDYAVLAKFEGRSKLSTYLTTVVQRLAYDYRVEQWGKWRPSKEAQRLGQTAIVLERMMTRDGFSFEEAVAVLTTGLQPAHNRRELAAMYLRLPQRMPRPVLVHDILAAHGISGEGTADGPLIRRERERIAREAAAALDRAIRELTAEDQLILQMRFWSGRSMPEIAAAVGIGARKLYKRVGRLVGVLRASLEDEGIAADEIAELLTFADVSVDPPDPRSGGKAETCPSNEGDEEPAQGSDNNDRSRFSR